MASKQIDWSKAGTRLRTSPRTPADGGRNPDWNFVAERWKTAEEYAGDELTTDQVEAAVDCPHALCGATAGEACRDSRQRPIPGSPHAKRRTAAGQARVASGEFVL